MTSPIPPQDYKRAADLIAESDLLVVAAGAGMGVDSGLPDFRGPEGFWREYPALGQRRMGFADIANPAAFAREPRLAWGFYGHRLELYRHTVPHAGFGLLKAWGASKPLAPWVFTSNVDGQFQTAGFDPAHIVECHGSIHHLQCTKPCGDEVWSDADFYPHVDDAACELLGDMPLCPECGALARPNILMFGDGAWNGERYEAREGRLLHAVAQSRRPVVVELGAGTHVPTVRFFSQSLVNHAGARLVRINLRESQVDSPQDVGLPCGALDALQTLDALIAIRG